MWPKSMQFIVESIAKNIGFKIMTIIGEYRSQDVYTDQWTVLILIYLWNYEAPRVQRPQFRWTTWTIVNPALTKITTSQDLNHSLGNDVGKSASSICSYFCQQQYNLVVLAVKGWRCFLDGKVTATVMALGFWLSSVGWLPRDRDRLQSQCLYGA